ncbi:MAG: hypothetical protein GF411_13205 [Candidatus Lokiarchaeota archaeon]|nr:hypothetical protein [Candidatus Lokiarchaeota archaeon]
MHRIKHPTKILNIIVLFVLILPSICSMVSASDQKSTGTSLPNYILKCYDGQGFADYPGGSSTLESTLNAVKLMSYVSDPIPRKYWMHIEHIVEKYKNMQSPFRGGFVDGDILSNSPDFRTSALIIETLNLLNRIHEINISWVQRYILSSFHESLSYDRWFTEGDLEQKYWALRTAFAINNVSLLGIRPISLNDVFPTINTRNNYPEDEIYLALGEHYFETENTGTFSKQGYETQLRMIETISMMIDDKTHQTTLFPLLIDTENTVRILTESLDSSDGLKHSSDLLSISASTKIYRALSYLGMVYTPFRDEFGLHRALCAIQEVKKQKNLETQSQKTNNMRLSDLISLNTIEEILLDSFNGEILLYEPVILVNNDRTPSFLYISQWKDIRKVPLVVPPEFFHECYETTKSDYLTLLISTSIICFGIGTFLIGISDRKKKLMLFSFLVLFLFSIQLWVNVNQIIQDIESSTIPSSSSQRVNSFRIEDNTASRLCTIYKDVRYLSQIAVDLSSPEVEKVFHSSTITPDAKPLSYDHKIRMPFSPKLRNLAQFLKNMITCDYSKSQDLQSSLTSIIERINIDTGYSEISIDGISHETSIACLKSLKDFLETSILDDEALISVLDVLVSTNNHYIDLTILDVEIGKCIVLLSNLIETNNLEHNMNCEIMVDDEIVDHITHTLLQGGIENPSSDDIEMALILYGLMVAMEYNYEGTVSITYRPDASSLEVKTVSDSTHLKFLKTIFPDPSLESVISHNIRSRLGSNPLRYLGDISVELLQRNGFSEILSTVYPDYILRRVCAMLYQSIGLSLPERGDHFRMNDDTSVTSYIMQKSRELMKNPDFDFSTSHFNVLLESIPTALAIFNDYIKTKGGRHQRG